MLDAHPAIGAQDGSPRARPPSRAPTTTRGARRARGAEPRVRGAVRLPLRRLRQPPAEARARRRSSASGSSARASEELDDGARRAGRDRGGPMGRTLVAHRRLLVGLGRPALPLAARDRGDRLDRDVVLLHRARQPPARRPPRTATRRAASAARSWEIHGGGFYRVEKFRVAPQRLPEPLYWFKWEAYTTWLSGFALLVRRLLRPRRDLPVDPSVADLDDVGGGRDRRSAGSCVAWLVYDGLCRVLGGERARCSRRASSRLVVLAAWARRSSSRRAPRTSRSARCSGRSWPRTSSS